MLMAFAARALPFSLAMAVWTGSRAVKVPWNFQTGASISAATATIGGKQLVLVASGSTLFAFGLPGAGN
jgi:hypothetical protein